MSAILLAASFIRFLMNCCNSIRGCARSVGICGPERQARKSFKLWQQATMAITRRAHTSLPLQ